MVGEKTRKENKQPVEQQSKTKSHAHTHTHELFCSLSLLSRSLACRRPHNPQIYTLPGNRLLRKETNKPKHHSTFCGHHNFSLGSARKILRPSFGGVCKFCVCVSRVLNIGGHSLSGKYGGWAAQQTQLRSSGSTRPTKATRNISFSSSVRFVWRWGQ